MRPHTDTTGVILAGGASRRMGVDKATLCLPDGRSMLTLVESMLGRVCATVVIAGDRPDLLAVRRTVIPDRFPGSALGGLHGAMAAVSTPWILAVACDMPLVTVELAQVLIARREGFEAVVPLTPRGVEPLCALYARNTLAVMERRLAAGECALHAFLAEVRTCYLGLDALPPGAESMLRNVNTPADLAAITPEA